MGLQLLLEPQLLRRTSGAVLAAASHVDVQNNMGRAIRFTFWACRSVFFSILIGAADHRHRHIVTFILYIAIMIRRTGQPVVSALAGVTIALFVTTWIPIFFRAHDRRCAVSACHCAAIRNFLAESRERLISPWLVAAFAWSLLWSAES